MSNVIKFYTTKGDYGCFSNFSRHQVKLKDQTWPTSEHYFQAQKFAGTKFESAVRKCDSPRDAADMGRDRALPLRPDWLQVRDDVMREAVYAKFSQNEDCKNTLLSTGDAELVEHTENDNYWADGGDGSGQNMLGKILMEVRQRLRDELSTEQQKELSNQEKFDKLEQEFKILVNSVKPKIEAELKLAKNALAKAVAISEEHGVPFTTDIYKWANNSYVPKSFGKIRAQLSEFDENDNLYFLLEDLNICSNVGGGWESDGWSRSSLRC